jgi:DNA-binding LytR/AlgR family response regulator
MLEGNKVKVLIVEDELITSEEIKEVLAQREFEIIGQATSGSEAIKCCEDQSPDIVLMDINIKGSIDGVELAKKLTTEYHCAIIFLTAYDDDYFLNRAKEVRPAAYIVKPFDGRNLVISIEMAINNIADAPFNNGDNNSAIVDDRIFVKDGSRFIKLEVETIKYVEAIGSYCIIHSEDQQHTLSINLKTFENRLMNPNFMRVHRSFLINAQKVDAINGNTIHIGDKQIPLSSGNREEVLARFRII